jgi:hypothetical protein
MSSSQFIRIVRSLKSDPEKADKGRIDTRPVAGSWIPGQEMHCLLCKCTLFRGNAEKSKSASHSESILCLNKGEQKEYGPRGGGGGNLWVWIGRIPDRLTRPGLPTQLQGSRMAEIICKSFSCDCPASPVYLDTGGAGKVPGAGGLPRRGIFRRPTSRSLWAEVRLFGKGAITSLDTVMFQKSPEYAPAHPWGRVLGIFETLLISSLFALFLLALRRQFRR